MSEGISPGGEKVGEQTLNDDKWHVSYVKKRNDAEQ